MEKKKKNNIFLKRSIYPNPVGKQGLLTGKSHLTHLKSNQTGEFVLTSKSHLAQHLFVQDNFGCAELCVVAAFAVTMVVGVGELTA